MDLPGVDDSGGRVLFLPPSARDGSVTRRVLAEAGIRCELSHTLTGLCDEAARGVGAILLPEEIIDHEDTSCLVELLGNQPPWSDIPIVVLARPHADPQYSSRTADLYGHVLLVPRPVWIAALLSTVRAALTSRNRQYQIGRLLDEQARNEEMLREADRRKDEFLATLAHELRNPLAPIRNAVAVLRQAGGGNEVGRRATAMMERQVGQMSHLIDDLLDVSRISRGKIVLRKTRAELASVVNQAVEAVRPLCESMRHDLTVALPVEAIYLDADPTRLAQVVGNLLTNACKFTDPGGRIDLAAELDGGGHAVVRVRDTGIGIATDRLPQIFEMFSQVETSLERQHGGLGIGLTLVKSLVEMHGGTVEARSPGLGHGSEFVVRLPVVPTGPPAVVVADAPTPAVAPRRILIVDDNRDAVESLATVLGLSGHDVLTAYDGAAGIEVADRVRPDAALLDIGLPQLSGYAVARIIREREWGRGVLLIAQTGWGQDEDRRRSREAGFDHHLVKPIDLTELTALLARPPN